MKGVSLTLEAFIAVTFLLMALIFFFKPMTVSESSESNYKKIAYDSLKSLDEGES